MENQEKDQLIQAAEDDDQKPKTSWKLYLVGVVQAVMVVVAIGTSQALGDVIPIFEFTACRYLTTLVISFSIVVLWKIDMRMKKEDLVVFIPYVCMDLTAVLFLFQAVKYIPAGTATCLRQVVMLSMTAIITFILEHTCSLTDASSVGLCLVGVFGITQPSFIFKNSLAHRSEPICKSPAYIGDNDTVSNLTMLWVNSTSADIVDSIVYPGYIFACLSSMSVVGLFFLGSRRISHINPLVVVFWVSLINTAVMSATMGLFETASFAVGSTCVTLFFGNVSSVCFGYIAFQAMALNLPPVVSAVLLTLELVLSLIAQYTVLKHINPGHGNAIEVLGSGLVIIGVLTNPLYGLFKQRTWFKPGTNREGTTE